MIEEMENLKDLYRLTDVEHNKVYEMIKQYYFKNVHSVEKPIAIIVGAQPGSGKGSLIGYSKTNFVDSNNILIITTDDYKPFHPKASEISKKYPTQYSAIVEEDSAKWTSEILKDTMNNKFNFIFEVTLKNDRIIERLKELKENGYQVVVRGLAVSYMESLLSAYERYEKQIEVRNWGRFFDPLQYNYTYDSIPNTLEHIEESDLYDAIEVYKRGKDIKSPQLIYGNYKKGYKVFEKQKFQYNTAKEAIIKCRNEQLKDINENMKERIDELEKRFIRRNANDKEMEALKRLKEIYLNYKM